MIMIMFTFETLVQTAGAFEELIKVRSAVQNPLERIEVAQLKRSEEGMQSYEWKMQKKELLAGKTSWNQLCLLK